MNSQEEEEEEEEGRGEEEEEEEEELEKGLNQVTAFSTNTEFSRIRLLKLAKSDVSFAFHIYH